MQENAEKLLVALYAESNGRKPHLSGINSRLGFEEQVFGRAVNLLYGAGLISGVVVRFGDDDESPVLVSVEDVLLTRRGAHYAEKALGIAATNSPIGKLQRIIELAAERGWSEVKAIADSELAELMKK
jgi:hypothetical protein